MRSKSQQIRIIQLKHMYKMHYELGIITKYAKTTNRNLKQGVFFLWILTKLLQKKIFVKNTI